MYNCNKKNIIYYYQSFPNWSLTRDVLILPSYGEDLSEIRTLYCLDKNCIIMSLLFMLFVNWYLCPELKRFGHHLLSVLKIGQRRARGRSRSKKSVRDFFVLLYFDYRHDFLIFSWLFDFVVDFVVDFVFEWFTPRPEPPFPLKKRWNGDHKTHINLHVKITFEELGGLFHQYCWNSQLKKENLVVLL